MVDLVKIRKKAKQGKEAAAADLPAAEPQKSPAEPAKPQPDSHESHGSHLSHESHRSPEISKLETFKQSAGKRRDIVIAREETTVQELLELLTFVIAGEHYAVDIEHIVEIVTPRPVTRIPNADESVVGIMSLRGTIVTLVDVRRKLRHTAAVKEGPDARVVVVEQKGETVGFAVDRVLRVVKKAVAEIEPHPVVHASELDEAVRGVFRVNNALTILLDLEKLLTPRALSA
ncbi:MAG TPA: chemotaxis protein CheW [Thermoanaerobaculia bacterium]|jgi:chemotaxis signal transduction protein